SSASISRQGIPAGTGSVKIASSVLRCLPLKDIWYHFLVSQETKEGGQSLLSPFAPRQKRQPLEKLHVLLVLQEGAMERRDDLARVALLEGLGVYVFFSQKLYPVQQ